jgi:hypothetical protein
MEDVGSFYDHWAYFTTMYWVYFVAIWYFYDHLVYFSRFGMLY